MPNPEESDDITMSSRVRWTYVSTVLALITLVSLPPLVVTASTGYTQLGQVPNVWFGLYATVVLMAATWTWGEETLDAVKEFRGNS